MSETKVSTVDRQKQFLWNNQSLLKAVLPAGIEPKRVIAVALAAMQKNKDLATCTPDSVLLSLMLAAQIGLDAGGTLGHAWLIPYKRECTMQLGFRGMIELAVRSKVVSSVVSEVVYEGEDFSFDRGTGEIHHPYSFDVDRRDDKIIGAYAIATLPDGKKLVEMMARSEIEKRKQVAMTKNVWNKWYKEMAQKTVVKRLFMSGKVRIPSSSVLGEGIEIDNSGETGSTQKIHAKVSDAPVSVAHDEQPNVQIGETKEAQNPYDKTEEDPAVNMEVNLGGKGTSSPSNKMQGKAPQNKAPEGPDLGAVLKKKKLKAPQVKKAMEFYLGRSCPLAELDPHEAALLAESIEQETPEDAEIYR